jgi:deoxycytidine triphosphate deaminase
MIVDPIKLVSGVEEEDATGYSVPVNAESIRGYQGNPFVKTEDQELKRETYEMMKMVDPGDPEKKREVYHLFPGVYEFTSSVYINLPKDHIGMLVADADVYEAGLSINQSIIPPGYKGLITAQLNVSGGESFLQPGTAVAELVVQKIKG